MKLNGAIVGRFIDFWQSHWASVSDRQPAPRSSIAKPKSSSTASFEDIVCKFLPSQHHRNPNFRLPLQFPAPPPETLLNTELLKMFASARKEIRIQTPNLTCAAVLNALVDALAREVHVTIITSERLMTMVCYRAT